MKEVKIFLLDLNPTSGLGSTLQGILESSTNPRIHFQMKSIKVCGSSVCDNEISRIISNFSPNVIFIVLSLHYLKQSNIIIQSLSGEPYNFPVILVIEGDKPDEMIEVFKLGVVDFIIPPLKAVDVLPRLWRLLEQKSRSEALTYKLKEKIGLKQLVGESPSFLEEIKKIPFISQCDASVLITGETGTGKELCARAIHYLSPRASKPFVPVSCGAIPVELVENELFGHIRGAFTGASISQPGLIEEADGGSLFLDDVDCLPLPAQAKFLRFLQEKEYRHLGSTKVHLADVRVIAASNVKLEKAVSEGRFRQDLFYRLNVIPLMLPLLRERKEDIPVLAQHFLYKYASAFHKQVKDFTSEALQKLVVYEWPGNVRELENVIERAVVFSKQTVIQSADIALPGSETTKCDKSFRQAKSEAMAHFERNYLRGLLLFHQGNITRAAKAAQKNRRAFWELIRKHKIRAQDFKSSHL